MAKIFYSWQSDTPNACNRGLIQSALERAVSNMRKNGNLTENPVIDRDTAFVPGAPDIGATILEKIDGSDVFVADVTIISASNVPRKTPNPNVLFELGYAMKALGSDRIILVQNTFFGGPESLPFDLRPRRILSYSSIPNATERAKARQKLTKDFERALRLILGFPIDLSGVWKTSWHSIRNDRLHEAFIEIPPDEGRLLPVTMTIRYYRNGKQTIVREFLILSRPERNKVELRGESFDWVERGNAKNYVCDTFNLTVANDGEIMQGEVILTHGVRSVVFRRTSTPKFNPPSSSYSN